jgi:Flp pilus assembly protein TadD
MASEPLTPPPISRDGAPSLAVTARRPLLVCAVLFLGTLLLFGRTVNYQFVNLDDSEYVVTNPDIQGGVTAHSVAWAFTHVHSSNWHPLTWIAHMVDYSAFGPAAGGHHAVNVLWHALNAALAFLALWRLTGDFWTSAVCAALFAWHPLRVESVAWVSERKDVLSGFFFFLTLWSYAGFAMHRRAGGRLLSSRYVATLLSFVLGLLCKPMLVTLPFVLLLLDVWPLRRLGLVPDGVAAAGARDGTASPPESLAALVLEKLPFLALSAAASLTTYLVQDSSGATFGAIPLDVRLGNALVSVARYLGKLVWPFGLSILYPYPASWPLPAVAGAGLLLACLTVGALVQLRRRPWLLVGWLWFLGMLVPVIGLVQVGVQAMADRYTYLPALGVQIAVLWTVRDLAATDARRHAAAWALAAVLLFCAVRTWQQVGVWQSSATLFQHATEVTDDNYLAYSNLGMALVGEQRFAEAEQSFRRVLAIDPPHFPAQTMWENGYMIHYALGVSLLRQNRLAEAGDEFRQVLERVPDYLEVNSHYGAILAMQGNLDGARERFVTALRYQPASQPARYNLARLDFVQGHVDDAIAGYRRAVELAPDDARTHCGLAEALQAKGLAADAAREREQAGRLAGNPAACPG